MITIVSSAKGGVGTTVVAAARALHAPRSLLVDLDGDLPDALGVNVSGRLGVFDWVASDAPDERLESLLVALGRSQGQWLLPAGTTTAPTSNDRWAHLTRWLQGWASRSGGVVVVDGGHQRLPEVLTAAAAHRLLVTRRCYLALRRAQSRADTPTGIVVVHEPGRGLDDVDIETAIGAPIVATVAYDPAIARAVDSGLLVSKLPSNLRKAVGHATT